MHIFFEENLNSDIVTLSTEESAHLARVLRLRQGQEIGLVDGKGGTAIASLLDVNPKNSMATVVKRQIRPSRPYHLHMVVAPTKNIDRFEWFLEKATECGIEEITPLICEHSERTVVKHDRLQKIVLSAMKQSQRAHLPRLNEAVRLKEFTKGKGQMPEVYMAHCGSGEKSLFQELYAPGSNATILIGPEGDFSLAEIHLMTEKGARAISLGESRLRTETAALVACMGFNFLNGEL
jgi:16S rRNA (uracil1498-N3)-methyltransferase